MLSQWLQQARNGRSVWLSDVRRGCEVLPEHVAVTVQLTLCDGARRDFSLPIPRWANGEQRQFVQQYVTAFVFNALSALSGREMAFYLDLRETEVVALLGELDDIFQVHKTARSGYGKVVNIANRLCRAFGGGTFSFAVRDRSAYVPAPPEVSRGGDLLPRLRRSVERCGSGVCCGIDIGGTDIKAAVAVDGRLVCVKEYDWNPAASLVAEGITGPIVLLVQLMACCAAGMTPALQAALDKDASDEEMTRAVAQSASMPLDVLGVSFPDVVIRDRIVGGESPKTKGMRENPAIDYETAFAGLGGLVDQLRPLCREGDCDMVRYYLGYGGGGAGLQRRSAGFQRRRHRPRAGHRLRRGLSGQRRQHPGDAGGAVRLSAGSGQPSPAAAAAGGSALHPQRKLRAARRAAVSGAGGGLPAGL